MILQDIKMGGTGPQSGLSPQIASQMDMNPKNITSPALFSLTKMELKWQKKLNVSLESRFPHRKPLINDSHQQKYASNDPNKIPYQRLELNSAKHKELQDELLNSTISRRNKKTDRVFPVKPIPVKTCSVIENNFAANYEPHPYSYAFFRSLNYAFNVNNPDCIENILLSSTKPHETTKNYASDYKLVNKSRLSDSINYDKVYKFVSCSDVSRQKNCSVNFQNIENKLHESDKKGQIFLREQQEMSFIGINITENHSINDSNKIYRPTATSHQEYIETSDGPYWCGICEKHFMHKRNLNIHMNLHYRQRSFQYDVCDQTYVQKEYPKDRYLIHDDEKSHQCNTVIKPIPVKYIT